MRKVLYQKWIPAEGVGTGAWYLSDNNNTGHFQTNIPGVFHQWGLAVIEGYEQAASYTVALIENEDGTIAEVSPVNLKFITN